MKVCCASDLHGHWPEIPDCDLLLLAGDYCPTPDYAQSHWYRTQFAPWIDKLSTRMKIIGVAGNHDFLFEQERPELLPKINWTYLQDSGTEWNGLKIWGSPWQLRFYDWAFNLEESQLKVRWDQIPLDTDILVLHGPPLGYGDFSTYGNVNVGSPSLLAKIKEIKPKLVVFGHIHTGYGLYILDDTKLVNASVVNEKYKLVNPPRVVEIE
jgi:Icc-related predicted phosphoesterase